MVPFCGKSEPSRSRRGISRGILRCRNRGSPEYGLVLIKVNHTDVGISLHALATPLLESICGFGTGIGFDSLLMVVFETGGGLREKPLGAPPSLLFLISRWKTPL